ncbi:MAG: glucosaminidase domain-containing protein, partial [Flavobacteriaceae bacterium]
LDTGVFQVVKVNSPEEYIAIFSDIARYEMEIYGIPASITLAQGLLESGFGRGELTLKTNNHFGIKCHTGWEGDYDLYDDDEKGECFRKYNHPRYSYRDHSIFLATRPRYAFLFNLPLNGYKRWAHGLRKAGYATDRKYPQKLISLIERYELYKYDRGVVVNAELPLLEGPLTDEVHIVQRGDTLYALSRRYNVAVDDIRIVNRIQGDTISVGQKLTIPSKRTN